MALENGKDLQQRVKPLPSEVRSVVRSGIAITSVGQAVEELVYNSIDAGGKNIYVSVNIEHFNVRVEDDGNGITEADLEILGSRYMTSKCHSLQDLTNLKFFGFRGEALASIIEVSGTVDIVTRHKSTEGKLELRKYFKDGKVSGSIEKYNCEHKAPGTAVIVGRLLSKLPVRQKRIDKGIQMEELKSRLEKIVLLNPSLNVKLLNEKGGARVFQFTGANSYSQAFDQLFQQRLGFKVNFMEEYFRFKTVFLSIGLSREWCKKKSYQFVFVNNRFIQRCRIHRWADEVIKEAEKEVNASSPKLDLYPIFILSITCPMNEYDITIEPKKETIEFKDWEDIHDGIEGLVTKFKIRNFGMMTTGPQPSISTMKSKHRDSNEKNVSNLSTFNVKTAIHSKFVARKESPKDDEHKSERSSSTRGSFLQERDRRRASESSIHIVKEDPRKRKRGLSVTFSKDFVPPRLHRVFGDIRPQKTLAIFKRFPQWKNEFNGNAGEGIRSSPQAPPLKKLRKFGEHQKASPNPRVKEPLPPPTCASTFRWKMNNFLKSHPDSEGDSQPSSTPSNPSTLSNKSLSESSRRLRLQLQSPQDEDNVMPIPPDELLRIRLDTLKTRSETYMNFIMAQKWKLSEPKKTILDKLSMVGKMLRMHERRVRASKKLNEMMGSEAAPSSASRNPFEFPKLRPSLLPVSSASKSSAQTIQGKYESDKAIRVDKYSPCPYF